MAVIEPGISEITTRGDHGHIITWGPMTTGDSGLQISMIGSARRTVQVIGTFSGPDRLSIEGSNNGTDYATLTDEHGNRLDFKGAGVSTVSELTRFIRPRVTAGSPTATVVMLVRKEAR